MQVEKNVINGKTSNKIALGIAGGTISQPMLEQFFVYLGSIIKDFEAHNSLALSLINNSTAYSFIIMFIVGISFVIGGRK